MVAGSKKGCGCSAGCNCGKSPAKKVLKGDQDQLPQQLQDAIKAAPGKMYNSPAKQAKQDPPKGWDDASVERFERDFPSGKGYYKRKPVEMSVKPHGIKKPNLAAQSAAEEKKSGKIMRGLQEASNRIKAENRKKNSPNKMWGAAKVARGKKKSPAKMGCYGKKK